MATVAEVLETLIPAGGYVVVGNDFGGVEFLECAPITKAQYEAGVIAFDSFKAKQDAIAADAKAALMTRLGITADELKLLLG